MPSTRKTSIAVFITITVVLIAIAVTLNVSWVVLHWQRIGLTIMGVIFFALIIAGLVVNVVFLVREIRRNEQHDSFINAVTHELKTPIASLRLYLETLKKRNVDETQRQEFYDIMLADTSRLLHTVEQVLRAGRTGQKGRSLTRVEIDLAEVAAESLDLARKQYHLSQEKLQLAVSPNGGEGSTVVIGDPEELRAALSNLIDNAVKYSGGDPRIKIEVTPRDESVFVSVHDNGIGIPPDELKQIFKRFYRVPGEFMARVKGTGLGLYIVQSVVEKHGGKVEAFSAGENQGTTFTIRLPRAYA
ncbi:MAG: HAMP domain-containing histidine kinase [Candidatus Koribacter versatilis]|uniref:histidine kinase n=1 Tax=Candidatus Korobacter versatilis TaxID=658062 RepID=A0A932A8D8_9BACT|nr:HAMP domain-containing histidine kinase [Candidatus Koribacter versatilis]